MDANSPMVEPNFDQKGNTIVKPRQNSDSIEPDSESPDATTRRPVTRSLTRKRAPTKVQAKKVKSGPSSSCKQKLKERSIFSFKVGLSGELHDAVNGVLQKSIKKDRIKPANDGSKALPPSEKASLLGNRMENFQGCPLNNGDGDHVEPKKGDQEKDFHGSPVTKKADKPDISNENTHEKLFPLLTPRTDGMEQDVCSPAVAEKIFTFGAIHCFRTLPTPKRDCYGSKMQSESDDAEELRVSPTKKSVPIVKEKDEGNESSKSSSEERDSDCFKEISPIDQGYHSSQETDIFSPEIVPADTPKFTLRPAKRLRSHGGIKFNEFSPDPLFPKGRYSLKYHCLLELKEVRSSSVFQSRTKRMGCQGFPNLINEATLGGAISLFSLALERMKSKMETETSKRSSEIVMSVAEGIHLQLQNVQSQMQKDVGKLTSLSKLKRKRLETRFQVLEMNLLVVMISSMNSSKSGLIQWWVLTTWFFLKFQGVINSYVDHHPSRRKEQQEQLKLIHEKFKDEINQHIQDCRSSIEGLEVHQIELKRNVERQTLERDISPA
ncbi:Meiosis-specific protein ASY3 [Vitis vinifera]|uniref:Meiosis-specific protein ASY3 n=1 Tax=Vitis vinifera TaxID=29760 RepID=A0A438E1K1_VITVI|nr:Meiosis-specific protein ASY3 [Vitis vinifera]